MSSFKIIDQLNPKIKLQKLEVLKLQKQKVNKSQQKESNKVNEVSVKTNAH